MKQNDTHRPRNRNRDSMRFRGLFLLHEPILLHDSRAIGQTRKFRDPGELGLCFCDVKCPAPRRNQ
jgi:hypothetical protein